MRIAVTNHHRKLVGGTESYLNQVIPLLESAGHQVKFFHEAEVSVGDPAIGSADHTRDWAELASFLPNVIFNHGLQSASLEYGLADIAPVAHFAHNYHGTCISGEKTRKLPHPVACGRCFGPGCLVQYLPRNCGGWSPLAMLTDYRTQSNRHSAMRRAQVVLTASQHMEREYKRNGVSNVQVVPLFVSQLHPAPRAPELGSFRILFAGRMTVIKGAGVLAHAASLIRDRSVELTLAGDGPERARLQQAFPTAHFPGWVSQDALRSLTAAHHVFAMPSIWPEPFGLAGLESGLPVAAFNVGGIPDWLTDGYNGTLAEPSSPEAFAAALIRCAAIPNARENARAAARRFTVARHMKMLIRILESVCAS